MAPIANNHRNYKVIRRKFLDSHIFNKFGKEYQDENGKTLVADKEENVRLVAALNSSEGDEREKFRKMLIVKNARVVIAVCNRFFPTAKTMVYEDLFQTGMLALTRCTYYFKKDETALFVTYAYNCIKMELFAYSSQNRSHLTIPRGILLSNKEFKKLKETGSRSGSIRRNYRWSAKSGIKANELYRKKSESLSHDKGYENCGSAPSGIDKVWSQDEIRLVDNRDECEFLWSVLEEKMTPVQLFVFKNRFVENPPKTKKYLSDCLGVNSYFVNLAIKDTESRVKALRLLGAFGNVGDYKVQCT